MFDLYKTIILHYIIISSDPLMACKKYLNPSSFIFDTLAQRTSKS